MIPSNKKIRTPGRLKERGDNCTGPSQRNGRMLLSTYILYINVKRDRVLGSARDHLVSLIWTTPGSDSNGIVVGCIHGVLGFG